MKTLDVFLTSTGLALMSVGFSTSTTIPAHAQNLTGPMLVAEQCSPLTDANYEACCMAQNRAEILTAGQIAQCPPLSTAAIGNPFSTTSTDSGPRNLNGDDGGGGNSGGGGGGDPGGGGGGSDPGGGGGGDPGGGGGQDPGKGHQDPGKGNQDPGKGNQDPGKGNQDNGKGNQDNGNRDNGKGNQDRGLKGNR
ncbi:hypothetical protein [Sinorhizobium meliloti]|uniref:hypothetical protein n=1 Tax=Rhizobium meliloti TaxID=382 RepID=UPI000FD430A6|nr:hypothetical protein [Sinorhizobium meliloti]RVM10664.1 hypothetical protein CN125_09575 [Sinorhizobium meliloti]